MIERAVLTPPPPPPSKSHKKVITCRYCGMDLWCMGKVQTPTAIGELSTSFIITNRAGGNWLCIIHFTLRLLLRGSKVEDAGPVGCIKHHQFKPV